MKASETLLGQLLKGPKQFLIPIYQRPYSWTRAQCAQLFDDVARIATAPEGALRAHFIGSVVYVERGLFQATAVPELLVIDGQQRLTTFTLLVEALARALGEAGEQASPSVSPQKLRNYFLLNGDEDGEQRFKLILSRTDDPTLRALIQGKALPDEPSARIVENFGYLQERIRSSGVPLEALYEGLSKLLIVQVALDRTQDNPQLIFESLNSTGLDLSQADLVRNFVLMGLEPTAQRELYDEHWAPMERTLGGDGDTFDRFLRAWLAMRTGDLPNLKAGYEAFKRHRQRHPGQSIADLVADLHRHARHYARIALGTESDPRLAAIWEGFDALRIDAPLPFLMFALELQQRGGVDLDELVQVARLVESWVLRRMVCDIPSNVLSRAFASLPQVVLEDALLDSLAAWFALRGERQRFPTDDEFRRALMTRNLYSNRAAAAQYILVRLENHGRKEPIERGRYTIEHILPQNERLSPEWLAMLGDDAAGVRDRWLHTLGNLTLTGYNPELSDRPFQTKRDMPGGFRDSSLRLNEGLRDLDGWTEPQIEARARRLASRAIEVWPAPRPSSQMLATFRPVMVTGAAAPTEGLEAGEVLVFEEPLLSLYLALEEGLTELGFLPLAQRTQRSFQRPGQTYSPVIACWPRQGKLHVDLRHELTKGRAKPDWFTVRSTDGGRPKVEVDLSTLDQVEAVLQYVQSVQLTASDSD